MSFRRGPDDYYGTGARLLAKSGHGVNFQGHALRPLEIADEVFEPKPLRGSA